MVYVQTNVDFSFSVFVLPTNTTTKVFNCLYLYRPGSWSRTNTFFVLYCVFRRYTHHASLNNRGSRGSVLMHVGAHHTHCVQITADFMYCLLTEHHLRAGRAAVALPRSTRPRGRAPLFPLHSQELLLSHPQSPTAPSCTNSRRKNI